METNQNNMQEPPQYAPGQQFDEQTNHTSPKDNPLGMEQNTYLMLMHLSQLAGMVVAGVGFVAPIVMWAINKDKDAEVDRHGKNIINFLISWIIYYTVSALLIFVLIGIPILVVLGFLQLIFIIIATVKANNKEFWKYPMTIPFFKIY